MNLEEILRSAASVHRGCVSWGKLALSSRKKAAAMISVFQGSRFLWGNIDSSCARTFLESIIAPSETLRKRGVDAQLVKPTASSLLGPSTDEERSRTIASASMLADDAPR